MALFYGNYLAFALLTFGGGTGVWLLERTLLPTRTRGAERLAVQRETSRNQRLLLVFVVIMALAALTAGLVIDKTNPASAVLREVGLMLALVCLLAPPLIALQRGRFHD